MRSRLACPGGLSSAEAGGTAFLHPTGVDSHGKGTYNMPALNPSQQRGWEPSQGCRGAGWMRAPMPLRPVQA